MSLSDATQTRAAGITFRNNSTPCATYAHARTQKENKNEGPKSQFQVYVSVGKGPKMLAK